MRQIAILARHSIKALVRKKDFYVLLGMLVALLVLLLSENFFGMGNISRYIKDIGYFFLWIFSFIIAVTFSARQIPDEIETKTILPLLAKPVSRVHLLLGRFLGSLLASSAAYTLFFIIYVFIVSIKGEGIAAALLAQAYILGIAFLGMVCAVSILMSLYFTYSAAVTYSFISYFAVMWFNDTLRNMAMLTTGIKAVLGNIAYYMIPHFEFYDMRIRLAHSWEALPLQAFFAVILYTVIYAGFILLIGYRRFKREIF